MTRTSKEPQPRKMIDTRSKLNNTTGSIKRKKSSDCIVIK